MGILKPSPQGVVQLPVATTVLSKADGVAEAIERELSLVERACRNAGAIQVRRAASAVEREEIWNLRRELSPALRKISPIKLNNDVVVPRGRVPQLFELIQRLQRDSGLPIAAFGHAGDGNIHVNIMVPPANSEAMARARQAERVLFEGVVALEGSISGEHGIGLIQKSYMDIMFEERQLELMRQIKKAFDPNNILNADKIF